MEQVAVLSLGGTITMATSEGGGITPTLGADELLAAVPGLAQVCRVRAETLARQPSASLTVEIVLEALARARELVDDGAAGVVLVQGTDTLEETAYLGDLVWDRDAPLVWTGAMRGADAASPDGPANLLAACRVAADPSSRGRGSMVVLDDDIHPARWVTKRHTSALGSFVSAPGRLLGAIVEGDVEYFSAPTPRPPALPSGNPDGVSVPLVMTHLGDAGSVFEHVVALRPDGIVLVATGAGHVSEEMAVPVKKAAGEIPVVLTTRIPDGPVATRTYGYPGSEMDLIDGGVIPGGWLEPVKARVLLELLCRGGLGVDDVRKEFGARSR